MKTLLYCIGLNELTERADEMLPKVRERLAQMMEAADKLQTYVYLFPADPVQWDSIDNEKFMSLCELLDEFGCGLVSNIDDRYPEWVDIANNCDAYYGSPSPLTLIFSDQKKPVMISN